MLTIQISVHSSIIQLKLHMLVFIYSGQIVLLREEVTKELDGTNQDSSLFIWTNAEPFFAGIDFGIFHHSILNGDPM